MWAIPIKKEQLVYYKYIYINIKFVTIAWVKGWFSSL